MLNFFSLFLYFPAETLMEFCGAEASCKLAQPSMNITNEETASLVLS